MNKARQADLSMKAHRLHQMYQEEQERLQEYYELVIFLTYLGFDSATNWLNDYRNS